MTAVHPFQGQIAEDELEHDHNTVTMIKITKMIIHCRSTIACIPTSPRSLATYNMPSHIRGAKLCRQEYKDNIRERSACHCYNRWSPFSIKAAAISLRCHDKGRIARSSGSFDSVLLFQSNRMEIATGRLPQDICSESWCSTLSVRG